MDDVPWDHTVGTDGTFWVLLTPRNESNSAGLMPSSIPPYSSILVPLAVKVQVRTPRGPGHGWLVPGQKAVGLFQGGPKAERPEREPEG